jgi:hypothetical protein
MTPATAAETIKRIADAAAAIGWQANVGACETAGAIISYLAAHPEKIDQFFADGLVTTLGDDDMWSSGCLTFHRKDGKVVTPKDLRISRQVRDLTKPNN